MRLERLAFTGAAGQKLDARLDLPDGEPRGYALFAHCFSCGKDLRGAVRIARALAAKDIGVLRFDFTGLGSSEGEFGGGLSADVDDLAAAADYLRGRGAGPLLLIGHSYGGAAVLAAAERIGDVAAVVTVAAPFAADHVLSHFGSNLATIEADGEAMVDLGGRPFRIKRSFLDDVRTHDQMARIGALGRPLLVLHSPIDRVVAPENGRMIFDAAGDPRSLVALDGADHMLSRNEDADHAAALIAAWADRYLPRAAAAAEMLPDDGVVTLEETRAGKFQQRVTAGGVRFFADEPVEVGGLASGPSPYDLLAAGLGACTAMTVRLYADRKGWPLGAIRTTVEHRKIHAADCDECETREGRIDTLSMALDLPGPLDAAQRQRLLEIADKCPVHRTLESEVRISTRERGPVGR